jgi:hypothetical protein
LVGRRHCAEHRDLVRRAVASPVSGASTNTVEPLSYFFPCSSTCAFAACSA